MDQLNKLCQEASGMPYLVSAAKKQMTGSKDGRMGNFSYPVHPSILLFIYERYHVLSLGKFVCGNCWIAVLHCANWFFLDL